MKSPQNEILAYLKIGGRLTVVKAREMFHSTELRRIVSRLRKEGYVICDTWRNESADDGRNTRFKEYYLA